MDLTEALIALTKAVEANTAALLRGAAPAPVQNVGTPEAVPTALALSGLIAPEEALSGFSNPATATVAAMFVLSAGLRHTGLVDAFADGVDALLGRSALLVTLGLMVAVGVVSAFINNTAAVAVLIPIVIGLCRRHAWSPSRFLMPLSFMAQIGGVCTLVGTSTNILVSDIARRSGMEPFGMFEFSALGLCFAGVGFVYLALMPPLLRRRVGDAPPQPLAARRAGCREEARG